MRSEKVHCAVRAVRGGNRCGRQQQPAKYSKRIQPATAGRHERRDSKGAGNMKGAIADAKGAARVEVGQAWAR